jgi:hypothetical protein
MWDYPTTPQLNNLTSTLSQVLTSSTITSFLLGSTATSLSPTTTAPRIDIASWQVGNKVLISVVNMNYIDVDEEVRIVLEGKVSSAESVWWGEGWKIDEGALVTEGMAALGVDIFIVVLE